MTQQVSDHARQVARLVADVMPNESVLRRARWKGHIADVLIATDAPQPGVTTLATVNLSQTNAMRDDMEQGYGVELLTCHYTEIQGCLDVMLDAAFLHLEDDFELYPGATLPEVISGRGVSTTMKHFFLVAPYVFDEQLVSIPTDERPTRYLMAVPISDEEMAMAAVDSYEALDHLLAQEEIDPFDWHRPSVATP